MGDNRKEYNIILDLDNTIINSLTPKEFKSLPLTDQKRLNTKFKSIEIDTSFITYERPHLQPFLDFLFKNFNVSVWTAASKSYMSFIIENIILIKPDRKLDLALFDIHCGVSKK